MIESKLSQILALLLSQSTKNDGLKFKLNNEEQDEIEEYISAVAKLALLKNEKKGYLVWGIKGQAKIINKKFTGKYERSLNLFSTLITYAFIRNFVLLLFVLVNTPAIASGQTLKSKQSKAIIHLNKINEQEYDKAITKLNVSFMANASNTFGFNLYQQILTKNPGHNVFISPLGINSLLSMVDAGACNKGNNHTSNILKTVLNYPLSCNIDAIDISSGNFLAHIFANEPDVQLVMANAIFANKQIQFYPNFFKLCQKKYYAKCSVLDFAEPKSLFKINDWVNEQTQGKIKAIISRLDPKSLAVLIDSVYFKGLWTEPFAKNATKTGQFHVDKVTIKPLPMMAKEIDMQYYASSDFQAVCLNYGQASRTNSPDPMRFSAYVFLPLPEISLSKLEQELTVNNFDKWRSLFRTESGYLEMPKFQIDFATSLKPDLTKLGLGQIFTDPDFSKMASLSPRIDDVIHKSYLEIDEEGTKAAAVTAVIAKPVIATANYQFPSHFIMIVDRPFVFMIRDNQTGAIIFLGSIYDPGTF